MSKQQYSKFSPVRGRNRTHREYGGLSFRDPEPDDYVIVDDEVYDVKKLIGQSGQTI